MTLLLSRRSLAVMAGLYPAIHAPRSQNDPRGLGDRPESSEAIRSQTMGAVALGRGWPATSAAMTLLLSRRSLAVMAGLDPAIHAPRSQNDPCGLGDRPESSEALSNDGRRSADPWLAATSAAMTLLLSRRFLAVMAGLDPAIHASRSQNDPCGLGDRPESSEAIRSQTMGAVARARGWPRQARP
jgi:hypothetical protein